MALGIFAKLGALVRRLDSFADGILVALSRLYTALAVKLDAAIDKLDEITKNLLHRYYRALDYLERLFRILRRLCRVLLPICLLFVPSIAGYLGAYFWYPNSSSDAIVLISMNSVLLLILLAAFRSKTTSASEPKAALAVASELDELGVGKKVFGALIAFGLLLLSAYINYGLVAGIMVFLFQVAVLYAMKALYGARQETPAAATVNISS